MHFKIVSESSTLPRNLLPGLMQLIDEGLLCRLHLCKKKGFRRLLGSKF